MRRSCKRLLLAVCWTALTLPSLAGAQAPVAEAPRLRVGDSWQWHSGAGRVDAIEDGLYVSSYSSRTSACSGCKAYQDSNLTVLRVVDAAGRGIAHPEARLPLLRFPLSVGKAWNVESYAFDPGRETAFVRTHRFTVEAYEAVTVPAGTFDAFRILYVRQHASRSGSPAADDRVLFWYSPTAKAVVKRQALTGPGAHDELVSYSVQILEAGNPGARER